MRKLLLRLCLILCAGLVLLPMIFILSNSLMSEAEILSRYSARILPTNAFDLFYEGRHFVEPAFLPDVLSLDQYARMMFRQPIFLHLYFNSMALALPIVLGSCLVAPPAAYAFESMKWRYKEGLFFIYIVVMLMPLQVALVPNFLVANWLHINRSYLAIILPGIFSPFPVFLIRQQIRSIPKECWEAAHLDGAAHRQYFGYIILPLTAPSIAASAILMMADAWNIVDQAVVFIKESWREPLSVYVSRVISDNPSMIFTLSVFYVILPLLVFLIGQQTLVQGVAISGLKEG